MSYSSHFYSSLAPYPSGLFNVENIAPTLITVLPKNEYEAILQKIKDLEIENKELKDKIELIAIKLREMRG